MIHRAYHTRQAVESSRAAANLEHHHHIGYGPRTAQQSRRFNRREVLLTSKSRSFSSKKKKEESSSSRRKFQRTTLYSFPAQGTLVVSLLPEVVHPGPTSGCQSEIRTLRTRRLWSLSFAVLADLGHPACDPYLEAQRKRTEHPQDIYASRRIPVIQSSTFILQITTTNSFRNLQASRSVGTPITHLSCSSSQFSIGRRHRPHRHQLDHYHQL